MDTKNMTLNIEPNNSPRWWVDSSYAMHLDMKSHMGIFMTIGKGGYVHSIVQTKAQH